MFSLPPDDGLEHVTEAVLIYVLYVLLVCPLQTIVFVETKRKVDELTRRLRRDG